MQKLFPRNLNSICNAKIFGSIHVFVFFLSIYLLFIFCSVCLSNYISISLSIYLSTYLSLTPSISVSPWHTICLIGHEIKFEKIFFSQSWSIIYLQDAPYHSALSVSYLWCICTSLTSINEQLPHSARPSHSPVCHTCIIVSHHHAFRAYTCLTQY